MTCTYTLNDNQPSYTCNIIPANIDYTGYVGNGSDNWKIQSEQRDDGRSVNYLRGRKLVGERVELEGYRVAVLKEKDDGIGGLSDDKVYEQTAQCTEVVDYGHESVPDSDKAAIGRVKEWIALSNQIHK